MAIANGPRPRPPGRAPAADFKRASQLRRGEHQTGTPEAAFSRIRTTAVALFARIVSRAEYCPRSGWGVLSHTRTGSGFWKKS